MSDFWIGVLVASLPWSIALSLSWRWFRRILEEIDHELDDMGFPQHSRKP